MPSTHILAPCAPCAHCGTEDPRHYCGCVEAPEYQPGDAAKTTYCGQYCQARHWPIHKPHCIALRGRKKLVRVALILKTVLLAYREIMYDVSLDSVDFRDGTLYLHRVQNPGSLLSTHCRFPRRLTTNPEHKEAALIANRYTLALSLLFQLTQRLLEGVASNLEVLQLTPTKKPWSTKFVPGEGPTMDPHYVFKVERVPDGETWIIDILGCQYGYRELLVPFDRHMRKTGCKNWEKAKTYNVPETKDLDLKTAGPFPVDVEYERQARLRFAEFVKTNVDQSLLDGSIAAYGHKLGRLVFDLKIKLALFVVGD
ncbi:hypothetical protein BO71DRAFT_457857 [Aspergillus ellipticus CBS 707.79]|uniref:MYND-type domain-containing protein n=1 Tax=Aspergillus ellipticus CBS 707.79 TaxID=1448320 RepID=A0A319D441_9EURO|nr:hypothetical protein BO71DRAFT_457857 [Aspergillus ellipticus CBS 707.79]